MSTTRTKPCESLVYGTAFNKTIRRLHRFIIQTEQLRDYFLTEQRPLAVKNPICAICVICGLRRRSWRPPLSLFCLMVSARETGLEPYQPSISLIALTAFFS